MNSMKTLAYMETRKLARFIDAQQAVVESIETAASDLLAFYPEVLPNSRETHRAYLLVGSERGFCGDFNHALLTRLETHLEEHGIEDPILIALGRKLHSLLEGDSRLVKALDGASTAEEVGDLLTDLVNTLTPLASQYPDIVLYALFHDSAGNIEVKLLLPPFKQERETNTVTVNAPILNLAPQTLFYELSEHYLFAVLHQVLNTSLHAESHSRVTHMESAVQHLEEEFEHLTQQFNALRQEEITEEIEVILLNATSLERVRGKFELK